MYCANCFTNPSTKMKKCGDCLEVVYCSVDCQFEHWPLHKPECVKKDLPECPICYEGITKKANKTITECGHLFHSSCLIKHVVLANVGCPLCRQPLADIEEDEEEENDDSSNNTSRDDDDDDDDEVLDLPVSQKRTITQILAELKRQNLTERHLVGLLLTTSFQPAWISRHIIMTEPDDMDILVMDILDNINTLSVDYRDGRSYSEVVQNVVATNEAGIAPPIINII